jgi:CobQ-like glutamine amidotransferase family enzyme
MSAESAVRIGLVLPDLLGTYGDSGNALVLRRQLEWRGIRARMVRISGMDAAPTSNLHGPALARNPDLADLLLSWATGTRLSRPPAGPVKRLRLKAAHVRPGPTRPGSSFSPQFRRNTAEGG